MFVELKPRDFGDARYARMVLTPTWVSDGNWAVRRTALRSKLQEVLAKEETAKVWLGAPHDNAVRSATDKELDKGIEDSRGSDGVELVVSEWLTRVGKDTYVQWLQAPSGGGAWIQEAYCKLLGIGAGDKVRTVLRGAEQISENVLVQVPETEGEAPRWCCMPYRNGRPLPPVTERKIAQQEQPQA